ncbi:MAG: PaaI family thioesterase [Planctomycetes bacterium]|nr:PaaI family thioesterase [Planctomycetota bacterium]
MSDELLRRISSKLPEQSNIDIPPKIFVDMEGEYIAYEEGKSLTARFPVKERYQNPLRAMQGGMIVAAMDNTFGPLSYMVAPPSVTTHINATYIRPVTAKDKFIDVTAMVVEVTKSTLHMRAEVRNLDGDLVAISQLINYFVKPA